MTRSQRSSIVILAALGGLLPILVYWIEHGGLGAPTFAGARGMSAAEQFAQVAAGLVVKPAYMFISLVLILALLRQKERGLAALRWGMIAFLLGEIFCAVNFIAYQHESLVSEYIHSYGMALAFGFFTYALLEMLDARVLHINRGHCSINGLCQTCKRVTPLACAARRVAILIVMLTISASFLPLTVSTSPESYATDLFGVPYAYARFDFYQWYEARLLPVLALILCACALMILLRPTGDPLPQSAKILFSAGLGALGFSLFRVILGALFAGELVWFEFWEELSELMFTGAFAFLLWQFRGALNLNFAAG
ncbi:MAG: hypothetical protein HFACDABA_02631 [Anaerolineales bacterium]|nr:hypothetical protein [Anaerolineales bacterium]